MKCISAVELVNTNKYQDHISSIEALALCERFYNFNTRFDYKTHYITSLKFAVPSKNCLSESAEIMGKIKISPQLENF